MEVKQPLKIVFHGATPTQFTQIRLNPKWIIKWKTLFSNLTSVSLPICEKLTPEYGGPGEWLLLLANCAVLLTQPEEAVTMLMKVVSVLEA